MTNDRAAEILKEHQLWRRGLPPYEDASSVPFTPKELGEALDHAIAVLDRDGEVNITIDKHNNPERAAAIKAATDEKLKDYTFDASKYIYLEWGDRKEVESGDRRAENTSGAHRRGAGRMKHLKNGLLDPDMPAQTMRLHLGELTAGEVRVAEAAIRWANSQIERNREDEMPPLQ